MEKILIEFNNAMRPGTTWRTKVRYNDEVIAYKSIRTCTWRRYEGFGLTLTNGNGTYYYTWPTIEHFDYVGEIGKLGDLSGITFIIQQGQARIELTQIKEVALAWLEENEDAA